jgi:hypothetical protein
MKGIAIHLPLPCEATHDHVRDTLPSADKLNILNDSIPTKEMKIWRSLVNMKKVLTALKYLKIINPYYSSIKIIDSCELQIDENVNNISESDSDMEINNSMLEHQPSSDYSNIIQQQHTVQQIGNAISDITDIEKYSSKRYKLFQLLIEI